MQVGRYDSECFVENFPLLLTIQDCENNYVGWDLLQRQFIEKLGDRNIDDVIAYIQNICSVDGNWKYLKIIKVSKAILSISHSNAKWVVHSAI